MAALLGLGFDCFLPTGELLSICPLDLLLRNGKGLVTLPASKGGTRHNVKESVTIQNPKLLVLLEELVLVKKEANLYRGSDLDRYGNAVSQAVSRSHEIFQS